jgi:hypothetical protein
MRRRVRQVKARGDDPFGRRHRSAWTGDQTRFRQVGRAEVDARVAVPPVSTPLDAARYRLSHTRTTPHDVAGTNAGTAAPTYTSIPAISFTGTALKSSTLLAAVPK